LVVDEEGELTEERNKRQSVVTPNTIDMAKHRNKSQRVNPQQIIAQFQETIEQLE
jgi:hypothetical protein